MAAAASHDTRVSALGGYAVFAALLSAAGLPIYIHAPKFYVDEFGVSLGALGAVLFALRLLDVVQDPLLGKLAAMTASARGKAVAIGVVVMCGGMLGLFAIAPMFSPVSWFAMMLTLVFSAFSFLTIAFYNQFCNTIWHNFHQALVFLGRNNLRIWTLTLRTRNSFDVFCLLSTYNQGDDHIYGDEGNDILHGQRGEDCKLLRE